MSGLVIPAQTHFRRPGLRSLTYCSLTLFTLSQSYLTVSRFWQMRTMRVRMLAEGHGSVSRRDSQESSKLSWLWCACLCPKKRKKTDDFVLFDDESSLESALLWSKNGTQPTSEDYLEFMPEHEKGLSNFAQSAKLPKPPADRFDY